MADDVRPVPQLLDERDGRREDALPLLARLHRARGEGPPGPDTLDVEKDREVAGACEQEVAVQAVGREV